MRLEISHNSLSIASGCWKKYYWNYDQKLTPIRKSAALRLGTIIHEAFNIYYSGGTDSDALNFITSTYDKKISEVEEVDKEDMTISKYTAAGMWAYYPYKDLGSMYTEVQPEVSFSVPVSGKRNVVLVGRVDGLVRTKDGNLWIREVKTTGLSPSQFKGRCNTSTQASTYVYALRKLGYDVKGVLYDCIKKPLLRKRVSENAEQFGMRIMADYREDARTPEDHRKAYIQHTEYRSDDQIYNYIIDTRYFIDDLRAKLRNHKWNRNMDSCWKFNSLCPYHTICFPKDPDKLTIELFFERRGDNGKETGRWTDSTAGIGEETERDYY